MVDHQVYLALAPLGQAAQQIPAQVGVDRLLPILRDEHHLTAHFVWFNRSSGMLCRLTVPHSTPGIDGKAGGVLVVWLRIGLCTEGGEAPGWPARISPVMDGGYLSHALVKSAPGATREHAGRM